METVARSLFCLILRSKIFNPAAMAAVSHRVVLPTSPPLAPAPAGLFDRAGDHDAGVERVAVEVVAEAGVEDDFFFVARGVEEAQRALLVAHGKAHVGGV